MVTEKSQCGEALPSTFPAGFLVRRVAHRPFACPPVYSLFFLQLAHHQMWRDETNAWALAARSRTLGELFYFARNEAHPYLWYILLWIASRATASVLALKFVAAIVGAANYLLLALFSPFSRLEKLLFFCSYYISFEYSVLARMYGIMLLLVLLYLRSKHPDPTVSLVMRCGWSHRKYGYVRCPADLCPLLGVRAFSVEKSLAAEASVASEDTSRGHYLCPVSGRELCFSCSHKAGQHGVEQRRPACSLA